MKHDESTCNSGCNSSGMCPGIALMVSGFAGIALHSITQWDWVFFFSMITLTPILMAGLHRSLNPFRKKPTQ
jgi:hypothetical protein